MRLIALLLASALAATRAAGAPTWHPKTVPDPTDPTRTCAVQEVAGYGSYIYQWPSKYDYVFWPYIDDNALWYCEGSGYIAFFTDFDRLGAAERGAIAAWLSGRDKPSDLKARLAQLEAIYALRQQDPDARNRLLRVLARRWQELGDVQRANDYRRTAYAQIVPRLAQPMPELLRLRYLYVAANYARLFGDTAASDAWLDKLRTEAANPKDPNDKETAAYLLKLSEDSVRIKPGGVLDPAPAAPP